MSLSECDKLRDLAKKGEEWGRAQYAFAEIVAEFDIPLKRCGGSLDNHFIVYDIIDYLKQQKRDN
jgi:hypothetical protein